MENGSPSELACPDELIKFPPLMVKFEAPGKKDAMKTKSE